LTSAVLALPAPAGIFFGKKNKPNPAERVPELIMTVKTDKDEGKRAAAAEELRQYDPAAHPEIVPILIDVLLNDPKASVRSEAAESLGKLRPATQEAGWALEQALEKDSSVRVRLRCRYALLGYHWGKSDGAPKDKPPSGKEPPKEQPMKVVPPINTIVPPAKPGSKTKAPAVINETTPPPLVEPSASKVPGFRPLPPGPMTPGTPRIVPANPPKLQAPPMKPNEGPALEPPGL
jgi:hypothetical protein